MRFPEHSFRLCSRDCAPVKSPSELQASPWVSWRCYLHHKPAPQLSLSHKRTHIGSSQTRAADSSAVVELRCFLYHVCQWAISLTIFFFFFFFGLQPLNVKKRGLFVSLVLDCQLRATPTTFTHTDSRLPRRVKFKPKGILQNSRCCIPACDIPFVNPLLFWMRCLPTVARSRWVHGVWIHMLSICQGFFSGGEGFSTAIIQESLRVRSSAAKLGLTCCRH